MDGAVKVIIFVFVSLFFIFGFVVLLNDNFAQKLRGVFVKDGSGQSGEGQQISNGDNFGGNDGTGSGSMGAGGEGTGTSQALSNTGYIISYDSLGQSPSQTDLRPVFISASNLNGQYTIEVTIENLGEATNIPTNVKIDFSGEETQTIELPIMSSSSFYIVRADYQNVATGNYNIDIKVDDGNLIDEGDEDNNYGTYEVNI